MILNPELRIKLLSYNTNNTLIVKKMQFKVHFQCKDIAVEGASCLSYLIKAGCSNVKIECSIGLV